MNIDKQTINDVYGITLVFINRNKQYFKNKEEKELALTAVEYFMYLLLNDKKMLKGFEGYNPVFDFGLYQEWLRERRYK
jgi:hypothetical protein